MTEVMHHPVNIRKRRIMEALKDEAAMNEPIIEEPAYEKPVIYEEVIEEVVYDEMLIYEGVIEEFIKVQEQKGELTNEETLTDDEATISVDLDDLTNKENAAREARTQKLIAEHKSEFNKKCLKLSLIENWEESKRDILEQLVKDTGELQELQDHLDDMLDTLAEQKIEIDEDDYMEFKMKHLEENPVHEPLDELLEPQPQTPKRKEKLAKRIKISATSTPISQKKPIKTEIVEKFEANEDGLVVIGPNGTTIAKTALTAINWSLSGAALTRKILMEVFDRETLAFHTLTGKPSPAFMDCDKPMKNQLDPLKVADIIHLVMQHTKLTAKEVRNAITTKCADENKMYRQREKKKQNAALKLQQDQKNNEK